MKKWMCHFTHVLEQKDFFSKFLKDIPKERNALNRTDYSPCQKLATKRFNQLKKSKIQPLTARADSLSYWHKLVQFLIGFITPFSLLGRLSLHVCSV